jgi:hypothetical protein
MTRKQFRKARVAVKLDHRSAADLRCDVPGYENALRLYLDSRYDCLEARLGGFSTEARTRITLYPLRAA